MSEIKNPEQQTDKPSVDKPPERLREAEAQKNNRRDELSPNHNKENTARTENPEKPASRSEAPTESKEQQRKNALRDTNTEGKAKESFTERNLKPINTDGLNVRETRSPEKANAEWKSRGYEKPPYDPNYQTKVVTPENKDFVRVYSYNADGSNNKYGPWLMDKKDVGGLNRSEIKDKYALPKEPTHMCDVKVPKNFTLQTGIANSVEGWGKGGNQQYDTLGKRLPPSSFVNERPIKDKEDNL